MKRKNCPKCGRICSSTDEAYYNILPDSDHGPFPFVLDIEKAAETNNTYRTTLWTGTHLQLTVMSIKPGEDIGFEIHPATDQFLRVEEGSGYTIMGKSEDKLDFRVPVQDGDAIIIPANTWHNVINTGQTPLKLYSIYAPPNHPFGTVHATKQDAELDEHDHV